MRGCHLEPRTMLALPGGLWSDGLLRIDRGVVETIAALNQFFQPLSEACCWSAVDRLVIKADRQTQIVPDGDVPVNDHRLLTNAAHRNPEGMGGERDSPSGPFPKHPDCCEAHRPPVLLPHLGRPFAIRTITRKAGSNSSQGQWRALNPSQAFATSCTWAALIS